MVRRPNPAAVLRRRIRREIRDYALPLMLGTP